VESSSPGGFWDFGIGATVGGFDDDVRERFLGVMLCVCLWGGGVVLVLIV
jgi:hypothetical protein